MKKFFCDFCGCEITPENPGGDVDLMVSYTKDNPLAYYFEDEYCRISPDDVCHKCVISLSQVIESWLQEHGGEWA